MLKVWIDLLKPPEWGGWTVAGRVGYVVTYVVLSAFVLLGAKWLAATLWS